MKEGDTCTTDAGQSGFYVQTGANPEDLSCIVGDSFDESRRNAAASTGQVLPPESQKQIDMTKE